MTFSSKVSTHVIFADCPAVMVDTVSHLFTEDRSFILLTENECYDAGQSDLYDGGRFCTENGWTCQNWDSQSPHSHNYSRMYISTLIRNRLNGSVKSQ